MIYDRVLHGTAAGDESTAPRSGDGSGAVPVEILSLRGEYRKFIVTFSPRGTMKKLIFAVLCFAIIFTGYRLEVGIEPVERDRSEGLHTAANSPGPPARIPASSDRTEEASSAADAQVLLVGTLITLAIVADAVPLQNDARHRSLP